MWAMSRRAVLIELTADERAALKGLVRSEAASQPHALRARVILLAARGAENGVIARKLGVGLQTVSLWRGRFAVGRLAALTDRPRGKPPLKYSPGERCRVVELASTCASERERRWSVRALAKATGVGRETVRKILREESLRLHRPEAFGAPVSLAFVKSLSPEVDAGSG